MTMLRDLTWRDLPRVVELEGALFGAHAWSEPTWWAELAGRPRRDYVAAVGPDGAVQGYAGLDHGGESADIMTVAVDPSLHGAGVGRALVDELVARAERGGASALLLEVRDDNAAARALYARTGFEHVSRRRGYYQPEGVDALVLRRLLSPVDGDAQ